MSTPANEEVIYEEREGIAIIAINRPAKKNTLTNSVIQGIEDGIDQASRSKEVAAIVLRGVGDTLTAGYDLTANRRDWDTPYDAPSIDHREGAWDPVRDLHFMGNNVRAGAWFADPNSQPRSITFPQGP